MRAKLASGLSGKMMSEIFGGFSVVPTLRKILERHLSATQLEIRSLMPNQEPLV